jgi:hypothetical protein
MLVLIDFLENNKVFGTRIHHHQLYASNSMLLAKQDCNLPDCAAVPDRPTGGDVRSVADTEEWRSNQISEECKSFMLGSKSQRFDPAGYPGSF